MVCGLYVQYAIIVEVVLVKLHQPPFPFHQILVWLYEYPHSYKAVLLHEPTFLHPFLIQI